MIRFMHFRQNKRDQVSVFKIKLKQPTGFVIKNPIKFEVPIPCKGKLNFFEVETNLPNTNEIKIELFEEEHRYMWINHH